MDNAERKRKLEEDEDERVESVDRVQKRRRLSTDAETSASVSPAVHGHQPYKLGQNLTSEVAVSPADHGHQPYELGQNLTWEVAVSPAVHGHQPYELGQNLTREVAVSPAVHQYQPYELGQNLDSRYVIRSKIGQGGQSQVLECWDRKALEFVVIKVEASEHEIDLLEKLAEIPQATSRIVQMRRCFLHQGFYCIVFEKLGPSLLELWKQNNHSPMPVDLVRVFGRQLLEAVANLHSKDIIHTNLELDNIALVSPVYVEHPDQDREMSHFRYWAESSAIKLIDFGHSMTVERQTKRKDRHCLDIVTSRRYRAPEVILGLDWTFPVDIWSVGCLLVELCTGKPLFDMDLEKTMDLELDLDLQHFATMQAVLGDDLPDNMAQRASELSGKEWTSDWEEWAFYGHSTLEECVSRRVQSSDSSVLTDLLKSLLQYAPSQRSTARAALEHPFFTNN